MKTLTITALVEVEVETRVEVDYEDAIGVGYLEGVESKDLLDQVEVELARQLHAALTPAFTYRGYEVWIKTEDIHIDKVEEDEDD